MPRFARYMNTVGGDRPQGTRAPAPQRQRRAAHPKGLPDVNHTAYSV